MKHAIVIGSSLAGLLAARVLAEHFEQVTVLERDLLPEHPRPRKGVPQGQHAHGLLAAGLNSLETLFHGITDELTTAGALSGDIGTALRYFQFGGYQVRSPSGLTGLTLSRPLLEFTVAARVKALPNVQFRPGCSVVALEANQDRTAVTGVRLEAGHMEADLVIDASGRGSQAPRWLVELGYARVPETVIKINVGYTTRMYRRRPDDLGGDLAMIMSPKAPEQKRSGVLVATEGDRWMLTVAGTLGDHVLGGEAEFLEAVRTLPAPDIYEVIQHAEPLSTPVSFKYPSNQRRFYERLRRVPSGFMVIGDAMCSFNPIYGQGMSVAALEALMLRAELHGGLQNLPARFYSRARTVIDTPWTIAVGEDLRYPEVKAPRGPVVSFLNWYVGRVLVASHTDPLVCTAFHHVSNLLRPPTSLFGVPVLLRILRSMLSRSTSQRREQTAPTPV